MRIAVLLIAASVAAQPAAQGSVPPHLRGVPESPTLPGVQDGGSTLEWYRGDLEDLLTRARESERCVMLSFRSEWSALSRKLDRVSLTDKRVVSELGDLLCFQIDSDTRAGKALRKRFTVQIPPTLVFLEPGGAIRDQVTGFRSPEALIYELRRIKRNEGTLSALRSVIADDPDALEARWELAHKLKDFGDLHGFKVEVAEIRARDPEGRSVASRCLRLSELVARAQARLDLEPLYAFVDSEKEPRLLFEGWAAIWRLEGMAARAAHDPEAAASHHERYFAAARTLWPLVPEDQHGYLGNNIAWSIYENRCCATREDLAFALDVASMAYAAAPSVPAVVDTYACCLFTVGEKEKALEAIDRCIELDPRNPGWRERKAEFLKNR
jgi:hypothetical protein